MILGDIMEPLEAGDAQAVLVTADEKILAWKHALARHDAAT